MSLGDPVVRLSVGPLHSCAVIDEFAARCWGYGEFFQLGAGVETVGDDELPSSVAPLSFPQPVKQLALGANHTCALFEDGTVRCWGSAEFGQLGIGVTTAMDFATAETFPRIDFGRPIESIAAGDFHTCAVTDDGRVACWGRGDVGQLGYGNVETLGDDEGIDAIGFVDVGGGVLTVAAGHEHTCALLENGRVRCWGSAEFGQLGEVSDANVGDNEVPATASDVELFE